MKNLQARKEQAIAEKQDAEDEDLPLKQLRVKESNPAEREWLDSKYCKVVNGDVVLDRMVRFNIKIGQVQDDISAYVIKQAPVEILLGISSLAKHSEGYRKMMEWFPSKTAVLEESYAYTILGQERRKRTKLPPKDRYYKGQEFELGIPDYDRDRIFYRPQYNLKPHEIEELKKLIMPLIDTGVYQPSTSPHNNPVLLVPESHHLYCIVHLLRNLFTRKMCIHHPVILKFIVYYHSSSAFQGSWIFST